MSDEKRNDPAGNTGRPGGPALDGGREGPGDAMPMPGAGGGAAGGAGGDQAGEPVWRYQVPPQGGDTSASESNAGHYTANAAGHGGGIVSAPPESNVNAPGRPQSGHGSATEPIAGGTAGAMSSEGRAGAMGGAAGGGNPGTDASNADSNLSGSGGSDRA
ncbi:hypothetical protein [Massilia consociata]|uniref:PE-PGRS family protein n=1 Tax=Massilia consociata TaxID=760117 RepID=A0ABV6FEC4_9BURK